MVTAIVDTQPHYCSQCSTYISQIMTTEIVEVGVINNLQGKI